MNNCLNKEEKSIRYFAIVNFWISTNNNNELYLHDHTNTYSIVKAMFRNQNYNTGQLRYFGNNLSRTSKQAEYIFYELYIGKVIRRVHQFIDQTVYRYLTLE